MTIEREEKTRRLERERAVRRSEELTHLVDEFRAGAFLDRLLEASPWNELLRSTEAVAQAFDTLQVTLFFLAEGSAPLADVKAAIAALHSGLHGVECANTRLRHQMTAQGVCRLSQVIPDVEEYYRIMHDMQANLRLHQSLSAEGLDQVREKPRCKPGLENMEAAESTAGRRAPAKKRNNRAATVKRTMLAREACGERATLLVPYASLPAATCAGKALGARPLANLHLHTPPPGSVLYLPALAGALDSMKSFLGGAATGKPLRSTKWKTPAFALNLRGRVTHRVSLGFSRGKRVPAFAVYGTAWLPLAELDEKLAAPLQGLHAVLLARHGPCIWWALPTHFPAQLLQQVATALGSTRLANLPLRWSGQERDVDKLRVLVPEGGVARAGRGREQRGDTLFQVQHSGHDLAADAPVINLDAQQTLACCERRSFLVADAHGLGVYALFR